MSHRKTRQWLQVQFGLVRSVHGVPNRKSHMRSIPSLRSFPSNSFEFPFQWSSESTHKIVDLCLKDITETQQQRPESPTVTLTWHASTYRVHKLHYRYACILGLTVALSGPFKEDVLALPLPTPLYNHVVNGVMFWVFFPWKSETKMTASTLKQDPNTERFRRMLFIRTKHNVRIFGGIPFIKLQNDS